MNKLDNLINLDNTFTYLSLDKVIIYNLRIEDLNMNELFTPIPLMGPTEGISENLKMFLNKLSLQDISIYQQVI